MPREITKHKTILEAIGSVESLSDLLAGRDGHAEHEIDLEVFAYGRNYNGKKVGPYVRLLSYEAGEEVVREGDWGGNTFYIPVDATLDVFVRDAAGGEKRVGEVPAGVSFGEMSILAGVPRNATVRVPAGGPASVLEITRPALRLLRKLPKFGSQLDVAYRKHGLGRTLAEVAEASAGAFNDRLLARLGKAARFVVYGKHHVLFREGERIDRLIFIRDGWVRRVGGAAYTPATGDSIAAGLDPSAGMDFLGAGNCLGLEGLEQDARWRYTATIPQRTEALEISIPHARADDELRREISRTFGGFSLADDEPTPARGLDRRSLAAAEREIATGLADATNLLVMDMDLCVRCGNCSMACHEVHGRSRLLRRGIHVERPVKIESRRTQHLLTPSVCIHCQDPECLTGCPTGAIGRFGGGYIDIDPKTCIGCGDCATQCPYNAISMIPRRSPAPPPKGRGRRLKDLFNLAPPAPPEPVTETEGLLAAKCNLCNNTPMNPPGARTHKYSCEENCPTGALVRVNPREYFDEVGRSVGLVYKDRAHAVGRNIHRRDPLARLWHVLGILSTVAVTLLFARALVARGLDEPLWGGGWLTLRWLTGLVGLVGVAAVMTYPARKQIYRRRAGALRYWMLAHVYLGVIAGIVLLMHGGRTTGGLLTSALMVSFDAVIVTGLFGLACYALVPRVMTSMEGEPLLVEDLRARRGELREKLAEIGAQSDERVRDLVARKVRRRFFSLRFLLRQYVRREELTTMLAHARASTEEAARELADERARRLFVEAVETAIVLRRIDALVYAHQLLKLWLAPHVVSTSLMLALMAAHVVQVVFFAAR
jgi:Fe-S-cluster-containing dehydrogenase component/CRP-like cAMP-binding protein